MSKHAWCRLWFATAIALLLAACGALEGLNSFSKGSCSGSDCSGDGGEGGAGDDASSDATMGDGRRLATASDIRAALALYIRADAILVGIVGALALCVT